MSLDRTGETKPNDANQSTSLYESPSIEDYQNVFRNTELDKSLSMSNDGMMEFGSAFDNSDEQGNSNESIDPGQLAETGDTNFVTYTDFSNVGKSLETKEPTPRDPWADDNPFVENLGLSKARFGPDGKIEEVQLPGKTLKRDAETGDYKTEMGDQAQVNWSKDVSGVDIKWKMADGTERVDHLSQNKIRGDLEKPTKMYTLDGVRSFELESGSEKGKTKLTVRTEDNKTHLFSGKQLESGTFIAQKYESIDRPSSLGKVGFAKGVEQAAKIIEASGKGLNKFDQAYLRELYEKAQSLKIDDRFGEGIKAALGETSDKTVRQTQEQSNAVLEIGRKNAPIERLMLQHPKKKPE